MVTTIRLQLRNDTAANWTSSNPVLAIGEKGYETDTKKWKTGDGTTAWNSLDYEHDDVVSGPASSVSGNIPVFSDVTGKVIGDSGVAASDLASMSGTESDEFEIGNTQTVFPVLENEISGSKSNLKFKGGGSNVDYFDGIILDNASYTSLKFRDYGYEETTGSPKGCIGNPAFVSNLDGWDVTAGANVTVNSVTRESAPNMYTENALQANITVSVMAGSSLVIRYNDCHNLLDQISSEIAIKMFQTPDASTRVVVETRSDYQWERWVYPEYTPNSTNWRYPKFTNPVLDDEYEDYSGEEFVVTFTNLPVGTYNIQLAYAMIYGQLIPYIRVCTGYNNTRYGLKIDLDDDLPPIFKVGSEEVALVSQTCRFRGVSATEPTDNSEGDIWIDNSSTSIVKMYDGSSWISLN